MTTHTHSPGPTAPTVVHLMQVTKQYDPETGARSMQFRVEYSEIEEGARPIHRFMSAYEQKKEPYDRK
jgi:splicing factor 3A subunit 2